MSWINRQELLMKASMGPRHQTQVDLGNLGKIRFLEAYMNPGDELLAPEKLGRRIDDGLVESMSRAFAKRTTAAEESCTTGVMIEGRMAGGVGTVWERERTVQG